MQKNEKLTAIVSAFLAAVFYAVSTPFSKLLLTNVQPVTMAGFLYLGAGIGVGIMYLFHYHQEADEERLKKDDLLYTIGMIVLDIAAPIFLMLGISQSDAASASLLENFEIVATTLIALLFFHEKVSSLLWTAIVFITASSMILSLEGTGSVHLSSGSLLVLLAAICWGLENNCTRRISNKSTYEIVTLKGFFSGGGSFLVSRIMHESMPSFPWILLVCALGFVSYGLSIFLYIRAQRTLGAAKTSAFYAAAPFIGTFLAFVFIGESLSAFYFADLFLMIIGSVLVILDTPGIRK